MMNNFRITCGAVMAAFGLFLIEQAVRVHGADAPATAGEVFNAALYISGLVIVYGK